MRCKWLVNLGFLRGLLPPSFASINGLSGTLGGQSFQLQTFTLLQMFYGTLPLASLIQRLREFSTRLWGSLSELLPRNDENL